MSLNPWGDRWAPEEANHFNPAYCGVLIYEFVRTYEKARKVPASFALVFCALPIALHPATRSRLPRSTTSQDYCRGSKRTAMSKWGLLTALAI